MLSVPIFESICIAIQCLDIIFLDRWFLDMQGLVPRPEGLSYKTNGDTRGFALGCKLQILVSLRVFGMERNYICPFRYRLVLCITKFTKNALPLITEKSPLRVSLSLVSLIWIFWRTCPSREASITRASLLRRSGHNVQRNSVFQNPFTIFIMITLLLRYISDTQHMFRRVKNWRPILQDREHCITPSRAARARLYKHARERNGTRLLTLLLPVCLMQFCKVTLTFDSVDKILWCDHSDESFLPLLTHGAICFSKFH